MRYSRYSWEDELAGSITGLVVLLTIVAVAAAAYLAVRATHQVIKGFAADPRNVFLWGLLGMAALFVSIAFFLGLQEFWLLSGAALAMLVLAARVVELYHDDLFQEPPSKELFVHEVLHEWWPEAA